VDDVSGMFHSVFASGRGIWRGTSGDGSKHPVATDFPHAGTDATVHTDCPEHDRADRAEFDKRLAPVVAYGFPQPLDD
jgi:hypothetical protein